MMEIYLIVDGDNLAHDLYHIPKGADITPELDLRLMAALKRWQGHQSRPIRIDLCLDPRRVPLKVEAPDVVYIAEPGMKADDRIIDKVVSRVSQSQPCVVITDDNDLAARVGEFGVMAIRADQFIVMANPSNPIFSDLPDEIPGGFIRDLSTGDRQSKTSPQNDALNHKLNKKDNSQDEINQLMERTLGLRQLGIGSNGQQSGGAETQPPRIDPEALTRLTMAAAEFTAESKGEKCIFHLTLKTWPLEKGVKFLRESFCKEHFDQVAPLFENVGNLVPGDLFALAALLAESCAREPDFVSRGGSLMDRVRLALLQAPGYYLTLEELVLLAGAHKSDIKRKARSSGANWLEIE